MEDFINKRKLIHVQLSSLNVSGEPNIPTVNEFDLNEMQRFAYRLVEYFNKTGNIQLLLLLIGEGGTGKTFTIYGLSKLIGIKLKRCAPTAKAAFLIKGQTLHSLFRIHCSKKSDYYQPLTGIQLSLFQHEFKGYI